ncbi:MAG: dehydrogenase, partial [Oscillospiraceae bacterium]
DVITGEWKDGRIGTIRGNRVGEGSFGGTVYHKGAACAFNTAFDKRGYYDCLLERIIEMFDSAKSPVPLDETIMVTRF